MSATEYILALDQGTTSSRAILFARDGRVVGVAQQEFPQILPAPGLVEHDPEAIWSSQLAVARRVLDESQVRAEQVAAIGVTNQRETTILWDRHTGRPVANAVVWQSRASAPVCERLKAEGLEPLFRRKTGLLLDAYFSGSKIRHLLDTHPDLRLRAERGEILFGTVDTWLLWRLTGGRLHVTDPSNASRTLLLNIHTLAWDDELLAALDVPRAMLPEIRPSSEVYGETDAQWFGRPVPLAAAIGDQQAATFGQNCFTPGSVKNTYGTGCFMLMNTGRRPVESRHNLLATVGWQIAGQTTYCLEGSVFIAGAVVQWLRDGLGLIKTSADVERLAMSVPDSGGVYLVPAFVGLGAPHWDSRARGAIFGLTRGATAGHLARAAVESIAFQTRDVLEAMSQDAAQPITHLKVDGGASRNDALMQFQADLLGVEVLRPVVAETTALGAAYLAGLAVGYWTDHDHVAQNWTLDRRFTPGKASQATDAQYARWKEAVRRSMNWENELTSP
ncbi:MAG TPA: glycerol kinase GlpK [Thermoguttaceae bacterium]|nr:glycerol kinase GlpK [Thermoguttaceae bacterium]